MGQIVKFFLACVLISFVEVTWGLVIESPAVKNVNSVLVDFGLDSRRFPQESLTGKLFSLVYKEDSQCTVSPAASTGLIAFASEKEVIKICDSVEHFYGVVQQQGYAAVLMGTKTFLDPGKSVGYTTGMDLSLFTIPVTFITQNDFNMIREMDLETDVIITLQNDYGPFYRMSIHPGFLFYQYGFPIAYFTLALYAIILLFFEMRSVGMVMNNLIVITIACFILGVVRGIKIATQEDDDLYLRVPPPLWLNAVNGVLFWFPLAVGTTAYTLTAFSWISMIKSIQKKDFADKIRKPVIIFFYALVPLSVIIPAIGAYHPFGGFFILSALLVAVGLFETFVFAFYGYRILNYLTYSSQQLKTKRSDLERKLTIFILGAVASWIAIVIILLVFMVVRQNPLSQPGPVVILIILRDVFIISLESLILHILRKGNKKMTTTKKTKSQSKSKTELTEKNDTKVDLDQ